MMKGQKASVLVSLVRERAETFFLIRRQQVFALAPVKTVGQPEQTNTILNLQEASWPMSKQSEQSSMILWVFSRFPTLTVESDCLDVFWCFDTAAARGDTPSRLRVPNASVRLPPARQPRVSPPVCSSSA